jgi:GAF domain-containing protein
MSAVREDFQQIEICLSDTGAYYVRNEPAIREILTHIHDGQFCVILGPRYCQKSLLLRDVKSRFEAIGEEVSLLVDLQDLSDTSDADFVAGFAALVQHNAQPIQLVPNEVNDELSLQRFLQECLVKLDRDLILLIDHLENIRTGPQQSLLRTLRAVYNNRKFDDRAKLGVVAASSFSVAAGALGPTSPFNIAHQVLVRDLCEGESVKLIQHIMSQNGGELTQGGLQRLVWAANGDRHLINQLCVHCLNSESGKPRAINELTVEAAINLIVREKAGQYPPLRETVRALEGDSIVLMNVLKILKRVQVPQHQLNLNLDPGADHLQLTGAVNPVPTGSGSTYQIRNEIYYLYLDEHFTHDRVVHVLSMAGEWEKAVGYLEQVMVNSPAHRSTLLGTILDSIYAARSTSEAYHHLARRLSRAFNIPKVGIYIQNLERSRLELVSHRRFQGRLQNNLSLDNPTHPEVEAYFNQHYLVLGSREDQLVIAPLLRNEWQCLGVAVVRGFNADPRGDDFQEFLAFLKQVGRAIGNVIHLTSLYETGKQVTSSLDLQQTMQTTVEAAIKAVLGAQRGSLLLWDEVKQKLLIRAHKGYRSKIAEEVRLGKGEGYVGIVYATGEPIRMGNVLADPRTLLKKDPDIRNQKSVIAVPLKAWGHVIGVLCLDNTSTYDAFQQSDLELLSTFAAQAAIAIQNARLSTELYRLGMNLNRRDLSSKKIFQLVVQSITTVTGARGANMILLRDTDKPELSVAQPAVVSVSDGLGPYYDANIRPRDAGLTLAVLRTHKPQAVTRPDQPPLINPLASEQGIQACLGLPMMIQDSITGVLFVHYDKPHFFSETEIKMLSLFANQAAMAIENRKLDQLKSQAKHEALRQTSQMVAHRLRNVLPVISDRIGRTLEKEALTSRGIKWNRLALDETRRAQKIVRDFETFSRAEVFERRTVLSGAELVQILREVVKENLAETDPVEVSCGESIKLLVQVNTDRLKDDFINFARDSVHHKPSELHISISYEAASANEIKQFELDENQNYLKFVYTDNGPGILPERKEKIFEPFFTTTSGSGLGLAIARYNAKVHGGTLIECGDHGVRFELYLPANKVVMNKQSLG